MALGVAGIALARMATTAQAQLHINMFISVKTIQLTKHFWIFSGGTGGSTAIYGSGIRSSGGTNYHARDSWKIRGSGGRTVNSFYTANKPTNEVVSLSPLFSSANNPIDIESMTKRLPGGSRTVWPYNEQSWPTSAINALALPIGSASRPIGCLFRNDVDDAANFDEIGIRNTPPNPVFTSGQRSRWIGSGILNKPISDFPYSGGYQSAISLFCCGIRNRNEHSIHRSIIPEPEKYALVFGLFAPAFVIFQRRLQ